MHMCTCLYIFCARCCNAYTAGCALNADALLAWPVKLHLLTRTLCAQAPMRRAMACLMGRWSRSNAWLRQGLAVAQQHWWLRQQVAGSCSSNHCRRQRWPRQLQQHPQQTAYSSALLLLAAMVQRSSSSRLTVLTLLPCTQTQQPHSQNLNPRLLE